MFNTPLNELDYEKVEAFCKNWPEGVRVEYKQKPGDISKVVSSFANTSGGIWIIGVKTDHRNMPIFPLCGYPLAPGIEEQITQSSYQGIYPPVIPNVRVISLPSNPNKVLVVVKVTESVDAPHAIENSTKVFIRVNSTTGHISLAHIDRVDSLLSRRRNAEERREKLFQRAFSLSRVSTPKLRVSIGPHYPDKQVLDLGQITQTFSQLDNDHKVQILASRTRLVQQGVISASGKSRYLHVNLFGQLCYECQLSVSSMPNVGGDNFDLVYITLQLASCVYAASLLLSKSPANLIIKATLEGIRNRSIIEDEATVSSLPPTPDHWMNKHRAVEDSVEAETYVLSEVLRIELQQHVVELIRQLMWAFDWADQRLANKVSAVLTKNHYLPPG